MSNLTYNPNVNIPYNNYNNNINMDFNNSGGNFKTSNYDYPSQSQIPQMDPRGAPQYNPNIENMRPQVRPNFDNYYENNDISVSKRSRKKTMSKYNDIDTFQETQDTKSTKFDWLLLVKKLVIYTALFLIMSHVKMDELVCRFIPFLSDNQILCMTVKGLILALVIILVQMLLLL